MIDGPKTYKSLQLVDAVRDDLREFTKECVSRSGERLSMSEALTAALRVARKFGNETEQELADVVDNRVDLREQPHRGRIAS